MEKKCTDAAQCDIALPLHLHTKGWTCAMTWVMAGPWPTDFLPAGRQAAPPPNHLVHFQLPTGIFLKTHGWRFAPLPEKLPRLPP